MFRDQKVFETLKNLIDIEVHRNFQVFANDFSKFTHVDKLNNETWQTRNGRAILKAVAWYSDQAKVKRDDNEFKMGIAPQERSFVFDKQFQEL